MAIDLRAAVFLDRDGTLMEDVDYCRNPADVHVFEGAGDALRSLRKAGYLTIIISNQSGIGRGRITRDEYEAVHAELLRQLGDGAIDATYFCPGAPVDDPPCRKPKPAMVFQAAKDHRLDLARSFFIGDKAIDIECGRNAGTRTILVRTGYGSREPACSPDFVAADINAASRRILEQRT